jgi:hypothetical protein
MSNFREEVKQMSSGSQDFSRIFGEIKREYLHFAESYATAVKSGANVAGQQIIKDVEELDQPADISAGKLIASVKIGVQHAAEQMANSGMDFVNQMKEKAKNKKKRK